MFSSHRQLMSLRTNPFILPSRSGTCAACNTGAHRKHTCGLHPQPAEAPPVKATPYLLPVKKRLCSTAPTAEPAEVAASGCAACAGGHRKHTCGRSVLPPPAKVRSEDYCAACHGGHRKHTCARKLGLGDEGGGSSTTGASGSAASGSSEDKASRKRRVGAELSASSDAEAGAAASETGCRACMGWHRGHTCGKSLRGST